MEIKIAMSPEGRFSVDKTEDVSIFMGIGMLELAKKVMLTPNDDTTETEEVIKEDADVM